MTLGLLVLLILLNPLEKTFALPQKSLTVDFFRTPQSPFRSGQTHIQDLTSQIQDKRIDIELGLQTQSSQALTWKTHREIVLASDFGANQDVASAISTDPLSIFTQPNSQSKIVMTLPPKTVFKVLQWRGDYSLVETQNKKQGFLETRSIVSRLDLGLFAKLKDGTWVPYKKRILNDLITPKEQTISVSQVADVKTSPSIAFDPAMNKQGPIIKIRKRTWYQSYLKGHGMVHWLDPKNNDQPNEQPNNQILQSSEELKSARLNLVDILKKQIHSVSFYQKDPRMGLVSGSGVFLTKDGSNWNQLSQFGNQNHPLFIRDTNDFLVGSSRTIDGGKTFSPYVNFKDWTQLLTRNLGHPPQQMQLLQINSKIQNSIVLAVATGEKTFLIEGKLTNQNFMGTDWRVLK